MTIQVPIKSEVPLIEGSIRVEALGIEEIGVKLLPDGRAASAHAMAQQRSYLLQITGRAAPSGSFWPPYYEIGRASCRERV